MTSVQTMKRKGKWHTSWGLFFHFLLLRGCWPVKWRTNKLCSDVQIHGLLCTVDLFPIPGRESLVTSQASHVANGETRWYILVVQAEVFLSHKRQVLLVLKDTDIILENCRLIGVSRHIPWAFHLLQVSLRGSLVRLKQAIIQVTYSLPNQHRIPFITWVNSP